MKLSLATAALLASAVITAALENQCDLRGNFLYCDSRGLITQPPGYWPGVKLLNLNNNSISTLYANSFSGFPNLHSLYITENALTVLELEIVAEMAGLQYLVLSSNKIHSIIQPPEGMIFSYLKDVQLSYNYVQSLSADAFSSAPNLESLALIANPFNVDGSKPILNNAKLTFIDLRHTNIQKLTSANLAGLPNLEKIWLDFSAVTDISGAFANTPVKEVDLRFTNVTEITAGTFSPSNSLVALYLPMSQLRKLETSAVSGAVPAGGAIVLTDTPLACACAYEGLFWWAEGKGVRLFAPCGSATCAFARR